MKTPADAFLFYPQVMKGADSIDLAQIGLSWFQDTDRTRTPGQYFQADGCPKRCPCPSLTHCLALLQ